MKGDRLQKFIEENAGKEFGDKYVYENMILPTRVVDPYKVIAVYLVLPWTTFEVPVEYEKIKNHVMFFEWLKDVFMPAAEKELKRI